MKKSSILISLIIASLFSTVSFASEQSTIMTAKADLEFMDCTLLEEALNDAQFVLEDAQLIDGKHTAQIISEESQKIEIFAGEMQKRSCGKELAIIRDQKQKSKNPAI